MLTGIEYAHSDEKRRFDRYAVRRARPFALAAQYAIAKSTNNQSPVFMQERIGANEVPFQAYKLRTLKSDNVTPINDITALMRRAGLDELIQYKNILEGAMSMTARRPLTPQEYEEAFDIGDPKTVDAYRKIVVPTRPGLVGSFVIKTHLGQIDDDEMKRERLELDIQDVIDGSYENDKKLFWTAIKLGFGNKMTRGDIRPVEPR